MISGKRDIIKEEKREGGFYRERLCGSFHRQFTLGDTVDVENIFRNPKNGVLTLTLPKKEQAKPRQIAISIN